MNQIVSMLLEPDIAEHDYVVPQLVMVYDGSISLDVSLAFMLFLL